MGRIPWPPPPRDEAEAERQIQELERDLVRARRGRVAAFAILGAELGLFVACLTLPVPKPPASPSPSPTVQPSPPPDCPAGQVLVPVTGFGGGGIVCTTPPPAACAIPDGIEGPHLVKSHEPADYQAQVNAAAQKVAGCADGPPSQCRIPLDKDSFYDALIAELRKGGLCAGRQAGADEACAGTSRRCQGYPVYGCPGRCDASVPCAKDDPMCLDTCRPGCKNGTVRWNVVADTWTRVE